MSQLYNYKPKKMNKTSISWTHYIYVTITASVLAYVTVMGSSSEEDDSAINMLPSIDTTFNEPVEDEPIEAEPIEAEPVEAELIEAEPIEVEQAQQPQSGSSGGKLKKKKTKTNNKNKKVNKTRSRK